MGIANLRSGRLICEKFGIAVSKLAELCHKGRLKAYCSEDWRPILASSQCNIKFKFTENIIFIIKSMNSSSIVAIEKNTKKNFKLHVGKRIKECKNDEISFKNCNESIEFLVNESNRIENEWRNGIKEIEIGCVNGVYLLYYNKNNVNDIFRRENVNQIRLYDNDLIFFELKEKEGEIDLKYIELNGYQYGGIKNCVTKLNIKKIQDSFGNSKYILSEYDENVIRVITSPFVSTLCKIIIDESNRKNNIYMQKINSLYSYLQQCAVDYFNAEDESCLKPLQIEDDFFIFEYEEYKKYFKFIEDEGKIRKKFFRYIEKLVFDESEIEKEVSLEIAISAIKQDPRIYMLHKCDDLEGDDVDSETTKIIKAYRMAIEGNNWKKIHEKLWPDREQGLPANDKFISGKLDKFESIARANGIPYIKARILRNINETNKEEIVKEMLFQMGVSSYGEM